MLLRFLTQKTPLWKPDRGLPLTKPLRGLFCAQFGLFSGRSLDVSMNTSLARLVALTGALAATVAMVASLLTFSLVRNYTQSQLPAQCLGYIAMPLGAQTLLVPANLCDPVNQEAIRSQQRPAAKPQPDMTA